MGRYSSGQRGQTVNLLVFTFAGSNPALPTNEVEILKLKAGVAQLVERQPSKLNVAGSNPVSRSIFLRRQESDFSDSTLYAGVAQG